ncbi:hypothetical protein [Pseudoalteromonas denitrificans]|uniref:Lipoprotein n=1 Tax=Pseudoalteromonas denitrificans DSM 6059 TaxID=1123010 RepID=A0A1I1P9A8_9GAMM|nr:hypothetical protein [Pseudoalteromonas denitrificans]SFD06484.1 hypothetical protein SAMN02745724_03367 [Pseudoalteromonas denitrificans DSM 6059]
MLKYSTTLLVLGLLLACNSESIKESKNTECAKNKHCNYSGGYSIALENENITPETQFHIVFSAPKNIKIQQAKLEGINMYMGSIPLFFEYKEGAWRATTMVGACAEPIMQWRLTLDFLDQTKSVNNDKAQNTLLYYFTSKY